MPPTERIDCRIPVDHAGMRLDQALAAILPAYSRSRLQQWLKTGQLRVNGCVWRPRDVVAGGETVSGELVLETETAATAQDIPLDIRHEDADLLVLDKPAGLVAHPAAGNRDGTLVNALLHHAPELATLPRAGLVHRLDKDTTGLLVVARGLRAHTALVEQLQARRIEREYLAVVNGVPVAGGTVDAPVGRHPVDRQRMAVTPGGKPAVTHYRVLRRFRAHALLRVKLETGRTHQIRVHMAHIRFPLLGDPVYGGRPRLPPDAAPRCIEIIRNFRRQALHAERLALTHPVTGERLEWRAEIPADLAELLAALGEDADRRHE
ncbi:MAG: 23S rRNA pseudouridine(1911/1915/1917) synthase RluD [Candidatus Contendobacter sp.]|nr:23S rRNA pseudouridine(1911/1915/1917) synthase RluD [Candidatus Contendobacter sp.]MDS4059208.1 23S rRNA pseudouridine(1911/1915/1917) synthase RluD [Candidatus Contendobacter sp.]